MNNSNRISARVLLAVASLAFSPAAWSLGLGDVTVESYLNQPLRARIDLISSERDDLSSVTAKLASAADYELIGASLEDLSVPVRFAVEQEGGDAYIVASSNVPVNNPILRLIVEVNWANGRMLREYTLFLDPPLVPEAAPESAPLPRIDMRESAPVTPPAAETAPAAPPEPAETRAPSEPRVQRVPQTGEYGPVASGETLWGIASNWSTGTGLDVNRVMIAIQRNNPDAFLNDNINLLKRGAILRMPEVSEVERISTSVAYSEVEQQEAEFTGQRAAAPVTSPSMPLLAEEAAAPPPAPQEPELPAEDLYTPAPEAEEAETETAAAEAEIAAEATEEAAAEEAVEAEQQAAAETASESVTEPVPADSLKLVPPSEASELDSTYGFEESEEAGDALVATQALRENLARTEEELITQQQQNAYLEERIKELEAQLEEAQDGNVADSDMANMEQRLREERQAQAREAAGEPWYSRYGAWLLGLLVVIAAAVGWRLSRRGARSSEDDAALRELADEAEEVLRVLDDRQDEEGSKPDEPESADEPDAADEVDEVDEPGKDETQEPAAGEGEKPQEKPAARTFGGQQEEADILDEESSDPEIQLDLARAYISMGDKEAARVILEEVASNGSEDQQAEARKMLDLM
jgi:pilus assembly protein FimV